MQGQWICVVISHSCFVCYQWQVEAKTVKMYWKSITWAMKRKWLRGALLQTCERNTHECLSGVKWKRKGNYYSNTPSKLLPLLEMPFLFSWKPFLSFFGWRKSCLWDRILTKAYYLLIGTSIYETIYAYRRKVISFQSIEQADIV